MPSKILYGTMGSFTTAIAGAASAPTLKNLASNGQKIGNEIDNTSAKEQWSLWVLKVRYTTAPAAGAFIQLHFITAVDGTNYEDGSDSVAPGTMTFVGSFIPLLVATQQRLPLFQTTYGQRILMPPCKFKPLIINNGSTAFTNTDDENVLSYRVYSDEVQ